MSVPVSMSANTSLLVSHVSYLPFSVEQDGARITLTAVSLQHTPSHIAAVSLAPIETATHYN